MAKKKTFVLRLTPEMYERLEKWAADEFRSANGQIEWILDQALKKAGRGALAQDTEPPEEEG
ncbi:MAG: Arc family DNA-binding protein [Clostridia bacterium]|nr:Arc family DNA-binding protein [Clostridia bacterium]